MDVVVSGASGLIGQALVPALEAAGHRVVRLVRRTPATGGEVMWRPDRGELDLSGVALPGVPLAVVHLAGENLGEGRWSEARRRVIKASRVDGTRTIVEAMLRLPTPPAVLVCASAVGYYGAHAGDAELAEDAPAGSDFLAEVCAAWEAEAQRAAAAGIRTARVRTGVVLAKEGGALARMLTPFKLGVGGKIGGGRQWFPWVTLGDAVRGYLHALARGDGALNLAAPGIVRQADFARALAKVLSRPSFMPLPGFAVKAMFGAMGDALLLGGQRVVPRRLLADGFTFEAPALEPALRDILGRPAR
jgi:uncharacterized protein (TIGR01777 family)